MRKYGQIQKWNGARGFGIIQVTVVERYFLHVSKIRSSNATADHDKPPVGAAVVFDISDTPVAEGQLRQAINADIVVDVLAQARAALATGTAQEATPEGGAL